jgi:hypothetical protein
MTAIISANNGAGTTSPLMVLSPYETAHASRNVIHDLIGGGIAVSLVAPRPRAGEIALLYADEATANAARLLHLIPTTFTLTETDVGSVGMTYVVDGEILPALDDVTVRRWVLTIGYQEIDAGGGAIL